MIQSIVRLFRRAVIRSKDSLKYSPLTAKVLLAGAKLRLRMVRDDAQRANLLTRAYRLAETAPTRQALRADAERYLNGTTGNIWREQQVGWIRYPRAAEDTHVNRSIVLKAPRPTGEKGVLLVMFEYNWLRLLANVKDLGYLGEKFDNVIEPFTVPDRGLRPPAGVTAIFGLGAASSELARQQATGQRAPDQKTEPLIESGRDNVVLRRAFEQGKVDLVAHKPGPTIAPGYSQCLHYLPSGEVRTTDIAHLASPYQEVESRKRLLQRRLTIPLM